jgi:hypothetical protein
MENQRVALQSFETVFQGTRCQGRMWEGVLLAWCSDSPPTLIIAALPLSEAYILRVYTNFF